MGLCHLLQCLLSTHAKRKFSDTENFHHIGNAVLEDKTILCFNICCQPPALRFYSSFICLPQRFCLVLIQPVFLAFSLAVLFCYWPPFILLFFTFPCCFFLCWLLPVGSPKVQCGFICGCEKKIFHMVHLQADGLAQPQPGCIPAPLLSHPRAISHSGSPHQARSWPSLWSWELPQYHPAALFLAEEVEPALSARTCPSAPHGVPPLLPAPSLEGAVGTCGTLAQIAFGPDGRTNYSAI